MCIKTKVFLIFFLILSFVFSVKETNAIIYFSDNFDENNLDNWTFIADSSDQESWKIIDNTTSWLSLTNNCSKNQANKGFKIVDGYQNLIGNLVKLNKNKKGFKVNENVAVSYQKMDELLIFSKEKIRQKDYSEVCANNFMALNYGSEVLIKAYNKDYFKRWLLQDSNL